MGSPHSSGWLHTYKYIGNNKNRLNGLFNWVEHEVGRQCGGMDGSGRSLT